MVEANASDTRNKADAKASAGVAGKASNMFKEMTTNTSLLGGFAGAPRRQLLIMDEARAVAGKGGGGGGWELRARVSLGGELGLFS